MRLVSAIFAGAGDSGSVRPVCCMSDVNHGRMDDENVHVIEIDGRLLTLLESFARLEQVPVQTILRRAVEEYVRKRIPRSEQHGDV